MIIDILFGILMLLAVIKGFRRGLVIAVFSVVAIIVGLAAAMKLSTLVADWLKDSTNVSVQWLPFISFAIVLIGVILLIRLGANLIEASMEVTLLGWVNRLGGIVLYIIVYTLAFSVFLFYATQLKLLNEETIAGSVVYSRIQPLAPLVINTFGKLIPWFKDMFTQLEGFFAQIAQRSGQ
ncbi:CvpA family protein [Paraflavitalea pollutisoli]|uniref:CvpA family protein n=1 Tax=Paraflavitalea pollutisoli TaxID=3034143 RepID=UPI0023EC6F60|nr:CvpA family protein [Paraflavitalea sp. H1-2-19X]